MEKIFPKELTETLKSLEILSTSFDPVTFGNLIDNLIQMPYCSEYSEIKKRVEALLVREIKRMAEPANSEKVIQIFAAEEMELLSRIGSDEMTLAIIPQNTSTKVAIFKGTGLLLKEDIPLAVQQNTDADFRVNQIRTFLGNHRISLEMVSGIAVKGGYLQPAEGGTFLVDEEMIKDTHNSTIEHPSNLGIIIGERLKSRKGEILLTTTDPISTDEMADPERILGVSGYFRKGSGAHYLNHRSIAKLLCGITGRRYDESIFITTHAGGGISTARHQSGRITSVLNAFSDMPGSSRAGNIPIEVVLEEIKGGRISLEELKRLIYSEGGLLNLAGTNDFKTLLHFRDMGSSDIQRQKINLILNFFTRAIAKSIMAVSGERGLPFVIAVSGGLSRSDEIMRLIYEMINLNVPLIPFGETFDLELLATENMLSRIRPERLKDYSKEKLIHSRKIAGIKRTIRKND
ncbi:MAG: hypothetical protein N3B13_10005 [Deltaproteobacteria bacterium]|nr:hypothetical protein [Deltaproteobacteria bacterium]